MYIKCNISTQYYSLIYYELFFYHYFCVACGTKCLWCDSSTFCNRCHHGYYSMQGNNNCIGEYLSRC